MAPIYTKALIENLLDVHALMSYYRATGKREHMEEAAKWLPRLKDSFHCLERELTRREEETE